MLKRELDYQVTITFHDYFRDPMAPDGEVEWAVREAFDNIGLTVLDVGPLMPVTPPKASNQVTGRFSHSLTASTATNQAMAHSDGTSSAAHA